MTARPPAPPPDLRLGAGPLERGAPASAGGLAPLRLSGDGAERALFERAAALPVVVPDALRTGVRRALEQRLTARPRRSWWLALAAPVLAAGWALASALAPHRPPPRAPVRAHTVIAATTPTPPIRPVAPPPPHRRAALPTRHPTPAPPPLTVETPGLTIQEFLSAPPEPVAAPPPRLLIARQDQPATALLLAGDRVAGTIRGAPVDLTVHPAQLVGTLGSSNVTLWLHGSQAEGDIGGIPTRFELLEVDGGQQLREGFAVRTSLPAGSTRLALSTGTLGWSPGCGAALPAVGPGVYEGLCATGGRVRVVIPPGWQRLPALPRLILLSFFLTERDPALARLFGP
jgi:hypothetical protein